MPKRTDAAPKQPTRPKRCGVSTCDRPYLTTGYCRAHYHRCRRHGDPQAHIPLPPLTDKGCSVEDCPRPHYGRGLCALHHRRLRADGDPGSPAPKKIVHDDTRRFWSKTRELPNGCIEWTGRRDPDGYGKFRNQTGSEQAHRWLWEQEHGALGSKTQLDHYRYPQDGCIGPACVRHLRPTTARENSLRGDTVAARNMAKTHCPQGHPYSGTNLMHQKDGARRCRACVNATNRACHQRRKSAR